MEDKLNKFKWIIVISFILWIGWLGLEKVVFDEPEIIPFETAEKILIDQYFDKNINETIYVYNIYGEVFYNITNHDSNSTIVCYFNHTLGYCSTEENCGYNEYSPIHCYKVKGREKLETDIWKELHFEKRN